MMRKVAVIGGGAAGMMAAAAAARAGASVTLYEKNEKLGKKIYITGKGRCNLTNACDRDVFFENVISNPRFLYSAFASFDTDAVQAFFREHGCSLKTERGERVFPVSDHASDVTKALERSLKENGVKVRLKTPVKAVLTEGEKGRTGADGEKTEEGRERAVGLLLSDGRKEEADAVILATGGLSYPTTGSDGAGLRMAEALGHSVIPCLPALVPLETRETWCAALQGLALKNVTLTLEMDGKKLYEGFGEMLYTHFGISGPLVLSASSYYSAALRKLAKKGKAAGECRVCLNLKPALSPKQMDDRLLRDFTSNRNKSFKNALDGLFPARLIPVMIGLSGLDPERKVHEITKEERRKFAGLIQKVQLAVTGTRGFSEAIITGGGVRVQEINPSTMESKRVKGLYFAGEMLDVDALTGGFNLQIAWSSGHLAGKSAGTADASDCSD